MHPKRRSKQSNPATYGLLESRLPEFQAVERANEEINRKVQLITAETFNPQDNPAAKYCPTCLCNNLRQFPNTGVVLCQRCGSEVQIMDYKLLLECPEQDIAPSPTQIEDSNDDIFIENINPENLGQPENREYEIVDSSEGGRIQHIRLKSVHSWNHYKIF